MINITAYKKADGTWGGSSSSDSRCHRENEKRLRQRTATIRREQTEKNATNKFEKSNYLNVLGFKHLVDIEGRAWAFVVVSSLTNSGESNWRKKQIRRRPRRRSLCAANTPKRMSKRCGH